MLVSSRSQNVRRNANCKMRGSSAAVVRMKLALFWVGVRTLQIDPIQDVERFEAQQRADAFGDREALEQTEVDGRVARSSEDVLRPRLPNVPRVAPPVRNAALFNHSAIF